MFDRFLVSKKEVARFKISPSNPFNLTRENVTQKPRVFNTSQIKQAIENVSLAADVKSTTYEPVTKIVEYILKDFFLHMHQSGLYNRQLKLWKTIGTATQCTISKIQKGIFKNIEPNTYFIDLFIDPNYPSICALTYEDLTEPKDLYAKFKTILNTSTSGNKANRLKGFFYFLNFTPGKSFTTKLEGLIDNFDPISKYESRILNTKDVRLNIVTFKKEDKNYSFQHIYPQIKILKAEGVSL